jgi:drug/metabolite transporter (DMT)-like permease
MLPYLLALASPFFYAISNFVDRFTLDGYLDKIGIRTYVALMGVVGIPFAAVFYLSAYQDIELMSPRNSLLAVSTGLLLNAGTAVYLLALKEADTSMTAGLFQLTVVFNFLFGRLLLGERLGVLSGVFALVVLVGSILLAVERDDDGRRLRKNTLTSMLLACGLVSLSDVLFKMSVADDGSYVSSQFVEYLTTVMLGICIFLLSKTVRVESLVLARKGGQAVMVLLLLNELVNLLGSFMMRYSSTHLNLTVLQTLLGVQPMYLIILGYLLIKGWPSRFRENIHRKNLLGRSFAVVVMCVGTIGIIFSSRSSIDS